MSYDISTPYIAAYLIVKKGNKIAFLMRANTDWMSGYYGLISGKVEKNESYSQAAVREAKEEAGIDIKSKDLKHVLTIHRYEPSKQAADWVDVYFEVKKWKGEPYNAEPQVHSELVWLEPSKLPDSVIASHKHGIKQIMAGNSYAEYGWESK